ncbi:MAG: penicillin-binding transpeptidase domain-containing protein [Planctomycetota bacterium]|nr:penicillin-binding transpeptidase domain-containing protein [Planctomycetota bacterium]
MKRIKILLGLIAVGLAGVLGRLVQVQVFDASDASDRAARMMYTVEPLEARRGRILDRFGGLAGGAVLAYDEPCWDLTLDYRFMLLTAGQDDPALKVDPKAIAKALRWRKSRVRDIALAQKITLVEADKLFAQRQADTLYWASEAAKEGGGDLAATMRQIIRRVEYLREKLARHDKGSPREEEWAHAVVRGLDEKMRNVLQKQMDETVGAAIRDSHKRKYPHDALACHVIGRTGPVDAREQRGRNLAGDQTEWIARIQNDYFDGDAVGKNGVELLCEELLRGRRGYRRENRYSKEVFDEVAAEPGKDIRLTIDTALQEAVTKEFASHDYTGAAAVIHVPTGDVLALVSYPTYDLNKFMQEFEALSKETILLPMRHRAVTQLYPPGSSLKPFVALAALSEGKITAGTSFTCHGHMYENMPDTLKCLGLHNAVEVVRAIRVSCNVFFYHVGEILGVRGLREWLAQAGCTQPPGTHLPDERAGRIPSDGKKGIAQRMGIGQIIGVTPLHMANVAATIARDGQFLSPRIVMDESFPQAARKLPVTAEALRTVKEGMPQRIDSNGDGRIDMHDQVVRAGNMAWFIGYAPREKPEIAFAVVVEYRPEHGNLIAGPIARELVRAAKRSFPKPEE